MSNLESIRKQNIERNKELLKKLKLDSLSSSISPEIKPKNKPKPQPKAKVNKPLPTRRSRRLAKDPEDERERDLQEDLAVKELLAQQKLRESRLLKLSGDFDIKDLLADPKLGNLLAEDSILGINETKELKLGLEIKDEPESQFSYELSVINDLGNNISKGAEANDGHNMDNKPSSSTSREDFSNLRLHSLTDPSRTKLTPHRITSLLFHSSTTDRLAFAGDTNGSLGIWAVDQKNEEEEPIVVLLKPHGRTISRITELPGRSTHIATASYDGSCRVLDLFKQTVVESISIFDESGSALGISDINSPSRNLVYATTLDGLFFKYDTREHPKEIRYRDLYRLHDKKIGGFCVNPSSENHVATASLDRSFKIWDLRSVSKRNSQSEILDGLSSPQNYGHFSSRLSISNVDWNSNQRLVCNGYDDRIRLFNLLSDNLTDADLGKRNKNRGVQQIKELLATRELPHNCQTGRWVSILKARWQRSPTDGLQKFAIGNMNRSIDVYTEDGNHIANLTAPETLTAVPSVVSFHPTNNWIMGGTSSGKVFLFN